MRTRFVAGLVLAAGLAVLAFRLATGTSSSAIPGVSDTVWSAQQTTLSLPSDQQKTSARMTEQQAEATVMQADKAYATSARAFLRVVSSPGLNGKLQWVVVVSAANGLPQSSGCSIPGDQILIYAFVDAETGQIDKGGYSSLQSASPSPGCQPTK